MNQHDSAETGAPSALVRLALRHGWAPTDPRDLAEWKRCFDWEKPGDEEFLSRFGREVRLWLDDNAEPHWFDGTPGGLDEPYTDVPAQPR